MHIYIYIHVYLCGHIHILTFLAGNDGCSYPILPTFRVTGYHSSTNLYLYVTMYVYTKILEFVQIYFGMHQIMYMLDTTSLTVHMCTFDVVFWIFDDEIGTGQIASNCGLFEGNKIHPFQHHSSAGDHPATIRVPGRVDSSPGVTWWFIPLSTGWSPSSLANLVYKSSNYGLQVIYLQLMGL